MLVAEFLPQAEVTLLDLNDYEMPIYSIDRENEGGIPEAAHRFRDAIRSADALLMSFAEHNGTYTAAYKNIFDWASRIEGKVFAGKPMMTMAASPGGRGGAGVLEVINKGAPHFGGEVKASLSVGRFSEHFDQEMGVLADATLSQSLRTALAALVK